LRQIEALKAVIEHSTVSAAAKVLHVSQPAMSKLIAHLEAEAGLQLLARIKGRLTPTEPGMRLYDEVDRTLAVWPTTKHTSSATEYYVRWMFHKMGMPKSMTPFSSRRQTAGARNCPAMGKFTFS
jgi:hypothetical protein